MATARSQIHSLDFAEQSRRAAAVTIAAMPVPASVPELRALLASRGLQPKKSLGQNFLIAEPLLKSIAQAADLTPSDDVLEVGPGVGTLTRQLALAARRVTAVELDQHMVAILQDTLAEAPNVTIIHGDILKLDLDRVLDVWAESLAGTTDPKPASPSYKVVANLPYYITSAVIRKLLDHPRRPSLLVLMVQVEVARRILAVPGDMSLLALSVQFYAQPKMVLKLPAGAFYPAPKVDSAVIRLAVRAERPAVDSDTFFRVAHAGFGQKRKQLRNSIAAGLRLATPQSEALLSHAGIDPQRRAQTLSLEEWIKLANEAEASGVVSHPIEE
jgi:16S rRNA (adenine1518-N6/adenine1519-N6)-dimethyltransferase